MKDGAAPFVKRTELEPVEHGLAAMLALFVATFGQVLVVTSLVPGSGFTRVGLAWCLSDAIPTGIALALLAARPHVTVLGSLIAGLAVELAAVGACSGLMAWDLWQAGQRAGQPLALVSDVMTGLYATKAGALAALAGRVGGLYLAARRQGELLEGAALGWPLAIGWSAALLSSGRITPQVILGLSGPIAFATFLAFVMPIAERATVAAFRALGVSEAEDREPPPR